VKTGLSGSYTSLQLYVKSYKRPILVILSIKLELIWLVLMQQVSYASNVRQNIIGLFVFFQIQTYYRPNLRTRKEYPVDMTLLFWSIYANKSFVAFTTYAYTESVSSSADHSLLHICSYKAALHMQVPSRNPCNIRANLTSLTGLYLSGVRICEIRNAKVRTVICERGCAKSRWLVGM